MTQLSELSGDFVFTAQVPPTAAATAIEVPIIRPPWNGTITSITWTPGAAITANGSNYFTLTVRNRQTGAGTVVPATRSYAATNSVSTTPEALTLSTTATDLQVAASDVLTAHFTHTGTGLAIPAGTVQVTMKLR